MRISRIRDSHEGEAVCESRPSSHSTSCKYELYGLTVSSSLELPELTAQLVEHNHDPDVTIEAGEVPVKIHNAMLSEEGFLVGQHEILIDIDRVGRYLVQEGRRIIVQPLTAITDERVRLFLYGAALSALLLQRGLMPLHASTVVIGGRGIVFAGPSGHGKSTLVASLAVQGYPVLSDDKIVLRPGPQGVYASPGPPVLSLFPAAAQVSGQPRKNRVSNLKKFGKHCYLVPHLYARTPLRVSHLFFTDWAEAGSSALTIKQLTPFESLVQLRGNLLLGSVIGPLGLEEEFVRWARTMIREVRLFSLQRIRDFSRLEEVLQGITAYVEEGHD